jgi:mono/diheme cytochrome c family protein
MTNASGLRSWVLGLVVATSACAWSVPADPGRNTALRSRTEIEAVTALTDEASAANDPATEALYVQHCGRCHAPLPPTHATAGQWPMYVQRYGPRAGLFGIERKRVLRWLQANAR